MGFGILKLLSSIFPLVLYIGSFIACALTIFRNAATGLYFLICILPFTYSLIKAQQYPLGKDILDILFISIVIGTFIQGKKLTKTKSFCPIILMAITTGFGFILGRFDSGALLPVDHVSRLQLLKNVMMMPLLYFLILANITTTRQIKLITVLIIFLVIIVDWRYWNNFLRWKTIASEFDYSMRRGAFGYLGSNHLAAFIVQYTAVALGILLYQSKSRYFPLLIVSVMCNVFILLYSFSRAAYLALSTIIVFFGLFRMKMLITAIILILLFGNLAVYLLPPSVISRVSSTKSEEGELESSAASRLVIWDQAFTLFKTNPVLGIGYNMTPYYINVHGLTNVHNYFLQVLVEAGIIGILIFFYLYYSAFRSGWLLFTSSTDSFLKGLGLGFCGCVIASLVSNIFGDRWSFIQMQGYWWTFWAMTDRSMIVQNKASKEFSEN